MKLETIQTDSNWGSEAASLNTNFQKVSTAVDKLEYATTKFKGYFPTETLLKSSVPKPIKGEYAWAGEPFPGVVYECLTSGAWNKTATIPNSGDLTLTGYAKTEEVLDVQNNLTRIERDVNIGNYIRNDIGIKIDDIRGLVQATWIENAKRDDYCINFVTTDSSTFPTWGYGVSISYMSNPSTIPIGQIQKIPEENIYDEIIIALNDGATAHLFLNWRNIPKGYDAVGYDGIKWVFSENAYYPFNFPKKSDVNTALTSANTALTSANIALTSADTALQQTEVIIDGFSQTNQIGSIGTAAPSMAFLQNAEEASRNGGYPKIENVVDMESPFKDILGYYTRFTNTQTTDQSNYRYESTEVRSNRPDLISFSFWVKKSQFSGKSFAQTIFIASYTHSPIALAQLSANISSRVDAPVGAKVTSDIKTSILNATIEYYKAVELGDWCQIIINLKNIVWNVEEGTKWRYGLGFNQQQSKWINQSLDYVNFQISEGQEVPIGVFVIKDVFGSVITYPRSMDGLLDMILVNSKNISLLEEKIQESSLKANKFVYNKTENANSYIQSHFNDSFDLRINFTTKRPYSMNNNPCFNFNSVQLISKSTSDATTVHGNTDDITPANYNGTYIGANHGCSDLRSVTSTGHGKTFADIGSEWSNGTYKFYIIGIIDANTLWILGENYKTYPLWQFRTVSNGDVLTHVSGATNTSSISVTTSTLVQFYPAIFISNLKILADGIEITESGTYYFEELNICENYDVFNVASTLDKIKSKVGSFTANPVYNQLGADKVARHSLNYKFTAANKCFVNTNFIAFQDLAISYFGFIQQSALSGNIKMYIPKALPIMDGTKQNDFRTIVDYNSVANTMNLTSEYWENPLLPPDRYIQASDNVAFNAGFIFDYGVGGTKRKEFINNSFFLYTSRKIYPYGMDSKISVNGGSIYNAVCFRIYSDINGFNKNGIINQNAFEYEGSLYVYADFNASGIFELSIPDKFIGRILNVFEKSSNVTILSETSNSKILVNVTSANPMYGYVVMKI